MPPGRARSPERPRPRPLTRRGCAHRHETKALVIVGHGDEQRALESKRDRPTRSQVTGKGADNVGDLAAAVMLLDRGA
jgi:hypothetical protein